MVAKRSRRTVLRRILDLVGDEVHELLDPAAGWPAVVRVKANGRPVLVALHVGAFSEKSYRGRDHVERRFQNPSVRSPVEAPAGMTPVLLGLWEEQGTPVLVGLDATRRVGKTTRQSFFAPLPILEHAAKTGWAEHENASGENVVAFHPVLFGTYVRMVRGGLPTIGREMTNVLEASGLFDDEPETPEERARRASMTLVRDAEFSKRVIGAYHGLCAMCGLNLGLVQGAHIYPASAPRSPDKVWNGLALCSNHHAAFDKHVLWVDPASREVRVNPALRERAATSPASKWFVEHTFDRIESPKRGADRPKEEMFSQRYEYFKERYAWAEAS